METVRLKMTIAYDGGSFQGWQSQPHGDTVQDHIERSVAEILGVPTRIHNASRTDAGVHALGQVAHVDVPADRLPLEKWSLALNDRLHPAIRITHVDAVDRSFDARKSARGKLYTYRIWNASYLHPLEVGRAWMVPGEIDLARLRECAALLEGEHDFAYFAAYRRQVEKSTVRHVLRIEAEQNGLLWQLRFHGKGFLYHMVRMMTGSLLRCARHRAEPQWLLDLLARRTPEKTRYCAPAEGLYLTEIRYD